MTSPEHSTSDRPENSGESVGEVGKRHEVTCILHALRTGESNNAAELISLVYNELRHLAAYRLAHEKPGQTLQATALVHESYLRLIEYDKQSWRDRRHFFGAAAEAMRRILISNAHRKRALKRGGDWLKADVSVGELLAKQPSVDIVDLNTALTEFEKIDPDAAELVKMRYFAGLTIKQIAEILKVSPRTADNIWAFAKAWLYRYLKDG